jgi:hypothetical protein
MAVGTSDHELAGKPRSATGPFTLVSGVCVLAALWCVATLAFVLAHSSLHGLHFTGPYAAYFAGDQLRYLAWVRDAGLDGLIADPFHAGASHVYLQPVFLISGLLWRAGLSIQLAYLVWTPVALGALVWGYASFTGRFLKGRERAAALALALLFLSPLVPLFDYAGILNANGAYRAVVVAGHGAAYWQAWGFLPTVIALGLMPVFVLGIAERAPTRSASIRTALAGLLVAWLHPWGGLELVLIAVGLLVIRRQRSDSGRLALAGAAAGLPLLYYAALAFVDPAWSLSALRGGTSGPAWPLLIAYLPLLLVALPALRRPVREQEHVLLLWLGAVVITYVVLWSSPYAALEGVSLPLSVLAIRGWRELRLARAWAWAAVLLAIVPGAFYSVHTFRDLFYSRDYAFALSTGEQRAVDSLHSETGSVLATPYLAAGLPALAGLLDGQVQTGTNLLFDGGLDPTATRRLLRGSRIASVVTDCLPGRADLSHLLAPLGFVTERYGCARVYRRPTPRQRVTS